MRHGYQGLLIILVVGMMLFAGCAGGQGGNSAMDVKPRFDGIYQTREITNYLGYLRFFPDGTLLFATFPLTDIVPRGDMETWFVPGGGVADASQSAWQTQGDILVFTLNMNNADYPCEAELEGERMWVTISADFNPEDTMFDFNPFNN